MHDFPSLKAGYAALWNAMQVIRVHDATAEAKGILAAKARYQAVEKLTQVPWFGIGIMHVREAGSPPNFHAWLHNGDPMFDHQHRPRQTVNVPAHRPPNPNVSWEEGGVDALTNSGLVGLTDWGPERIAYALEKFNGFGYRDYHNIPSPYLWGGTSVQKTGKYVADRQYDATVLDPQIGGMALLKMLMQLDASVSFAPIPVA